MRELIGVVGKSGTGKSTALRNLDPKETYIISPYKETVNIPKFRENYEKLKEDRSNIKTANFSIIDNLERLKKAVEYVSSSLPHIKVLVIEDITHLFNKYTLSGSFRDKAQGKEGWSRWGDFGADVFNTLFSKSATREDLILVYHFHVEENESLEQGIRTPGKLLDREVDIPSYFNWLLYTKVDPPNMEDPTANRYWYATNNDGVRPAKTPIGAFEEVYIENDMKKVIDVMLAY